MVQGASVGDVTGVFPLAGGHANGFHGAPDRGHGPIDRQHGATRR